ncbi:aminoacyl-tRNA hydrolase [Patescibacteria group bacterium]|nr:aminoacyl-tRNA hydrolase [Patescibacteria group bacterium]MCL5409388.1 aminoacyl-tRNA hydrolase [Patescibacteria group bacterium]
MKIVVGLGNPGKQYLVTRHNLGFQVVEELGKKIPSVASWSHDERLKSKVLQDQQLFLIEPQTYMNNSGLAVAKIVNFYKIPLGDLIVIHDELDLPLGKIKVKQGGGSAGHHGIESIVANLGTDDFVRVRLGIGNQISQQGEKDLAFFDASHFVLEPFLPQEKTKVKTMIAGAVDLVEYLLKNGLAETQNQFH